MKNKKLTINDREHVSIGEMEIAPINLIPINQITILVF